MTTEIKARLNDLETQMQANATALEEAKDRLAKDPNPRHAEEVTRLKQAAENLAAAYQSAKVLEGKAQSANQSNQSKQDQRKLADLEARADQKKAEILKTIKTLTAQFKDLEALADDQRKLAGQFGKMGFQYKGVYKLLFVLRDSLATWGDNLHRYEQNKAAANQVKTAKLSPLMKAVDAIRYHDPDETPKRVRLVNDDPGPESRPENIRIN